jgi:hypothetical protein
MRVHFISRLALLLIAGFLVVASQVWSPGTIEWLFIAGGVVMIFAAALDAEAEGSAQRTLDAVIVVLGIFSVVQAIVFNGSTLEWFSFGTAAALAALSTLGLVIHETSTERIVHELSVTAPERPRSPAYMPFPH